MKLRAVDRPRAGILLLVGLLIVVVSPACSSGGGSTQSCAGDSENYQGRCMPHITANYLKCIDGRGFSYSNEVSGGVTLPRVADSTFTLAYKHSKEEDTTVALQIVHDCLTLAEQSATSDTDRGTARQYAQQATRYIDVVKQRLPAIELVPSGTLNCGSADVGAAPSGGTCEVTIKSTGVVALEITGAEVTGANSGDFTADGKCQGTLAPNQSCVMTVQFRPSGTGERNATLVIHQNLPPPDHGTPLHLTGTGTGTGSPPGGHTLTVTVDASAATVRVSSNPPGIDCPGTCTMTFDDGADITLTATYDQSSGQLSWDGCGQANGGSCTVHLISNSAVTVHLVPPLG
jgi:hypothetical protein